MPTHTVADSIDMVVIIQMDEIFVAGSDQSEIGFAYCSYAK